MKTKHFVLCLCIFGALQSFGQKSNAPKFGKGLFNLVGKDSSWTMKIGTRMQFLTTANWTNPDDDGFKNLKENFSIRRARLKFDGFAYSPKLKYKIEFGLSNRDLSGGSQFTSNAPRMF